MRPSEVDRGVRELSDRDAPDFLDGNEIAVLAFLDGEAPSQKLRSRVDVLAAKLGIAVGTLDISRNRLVADAMGVRAAPVTIVFLAGQSVDHLMGVPPQDVLEDTVNVRLAARRQDDG